jgi:hypothetical protein
MRRYPNYFRIKLPEVVWSGEEEQKENAARRFSAAPAHADQRRQGAVYPPQLCVPSRNLGAGSDIIQDMTTMMLIILLAWFPLSLPLAVLVGKCIKFGSGEPDAHLTPKQRANRRSQDFFRSRRPLGTG